MKGLDALSPLSGRIVNNIIGGGIRTDRRSRNNVEQNGGEYVFRIMNKSDIQKAHQFLGASQWHDDSMLIGTYLSIGSVNQIKDRYFLSRRNQWKMFNKLSSNATIITGYGTNPYRIELMSKRDFESEFL